MGLTEDWKKNDEISNDYRLYERLCLKLLLKWQMIRQKSLQQESKTRDCKKYENMNTQGDLWVMHILWRD
jgi:hypothetical protein